MQSKCQTSVSLPQVPALDAQSCAAELHHALAKSDYHQASSLIRLAPHPGVFEMVNKQQQNALHLAGKQHYQPVFIDQTGKNRRGYDA